MGRKLLNIQADDWFENAHLEYVENLLTSITHSAIPRKPEEAKFFSDLHLFYSYRVLHNTKIKSDRALLISSIKKSMIWNELIAKHENLDITVVSISAPSAKPLSRGARFSHYVAEFFYPIYKKMDDTLRSNQAIVFLIKLIKTPRIRHQPQSLLRARVRHKVEIEGYVFDKIEIVALIEVMLLVAESEAAKNVLENTRLLFDLAPDRIWFEHALLRSTYSVKNGGDEINGAETPYDIFRIKEDSIQSTDVTIVVKTYLVEKDVTLFFQNKIGVLKPQLPREDECLAINKLSLTLKKGNTLLTQGEFYSTTDLFIGPIGINLVNLDADGLVALKHGSFVAYDGEFPPFLLSSAGISNYWHALIDSLPRLVLLDDYRPIILMGEPSSEIVGLIKMLKPHAKIYTYPHSGVIINSVIRSPLSVLSKEPFWNGEAPSFDVSTLLKFRGELLKTFSGRSDGKSDSYADKVFLIRSSTHRTSEIGNFKKLLEGEGFLAINPSELNIVEQAEMFSRAKVIVGEVGAAWANLIFCAPGTRVFSLCAKSSAPTPLFGGFAHILGLDFFPIAFPDGWSFDPQNHWNNTPEAYFQSGFKVNEEHVARAVNFISKNSILN